MIARIILMIFIGTAYHLKDVFANDIDGKRESQYAYSNHPKSKYKKFQQNLPDEKENLDSYNTKYDFSPKDELNKNFKAPERTDSSLQRGNKNHHQHRHNHHQSADMYHQNSLHNNPERHFRSRVTDKADFSTDLSDNDYISEYKMASDVSIPHIEPYIKNETKKNALDNQFQLNSQPSSFKNKNNIKTKSSEQEFGVKKKGYARTSSTTRQSKNQNYSQMKRKKQNHLSNDDTIYEHSKDDFNKNKGPDNDKFQEQIKNKYSPDSTKKDSSRFKDKEQMESINVQKQMTPSLRESENEFYEKDIDQQPKENTNEPFDDDEDEEMEHDVRRTEENLIAERDKYSIPDPDQKDVEDVEKRQESEDVTESGAENNSNSLNDNIGGEGITDPEKSYEYDEYMTTADIDKRNDQSYGDSRRPNHDDATYSSSDDKRSLKNSINSKQEQRIENGFSANSESNEDTDSTIQSIDITTHELNKNSHFNASKAEATKRQAFKNSIEDTLASSETSSIKNLPISKRSEDNYNNETPFGDENNQNQRSPNGANKEANDEDTLQTEPFTDVPENSNFQKDSGLGSENKLKNNFENFPHVREANRYGKYNSRKHSVKEHKNKNYNKQKIGMPNLNKWFKKEMSDINTPFLKTKSKKWKKMKSKPKYWSKNKFSSRKPGNKKLPKYGDNAFKKRSNINQVYRKNSNLKNDRNHSYVPNNQRFLEKTSYATGNNKREEQIFKDEKNRLQYRLPSSSKNTKDVKRDQQTDSLVKDDLMDTTKDVLSEAILESPHVDEKIARTVEDFKTRQTILKDKNLNKETNVVENEKEKVRDAIHLVSDNKINSMDELSTDNGVTEKKYRSSNINTLRNKDTGKQTKTRKLMGSNKERKFGVPFPKNKNKSLDLNKPIQKESPKINFSNKNFDEDSSMPNEKQTTVAVDIQPPESNFSNVFKNGELIVITTGPSNLGLQTDHKENLPQNSKIDSFGQVNDYGGKRNENYKNLEYEQQEGQTDQSATEVENFDYDYGNTLSETYSNQNNLDSVEYPRVRDSFEYSTEMFNASGQEEFLKEEKVQKESKTLLRNKDTFKNETSKLKGERKSEIRNNKESYHESFLKEKDENKYPSLNDRYENRKKSIPKNVNEEEIEANQQDYFETDMDPSQDNYLSSRREMFPPNSFRKTPERRKQKLGKNSKSKPNELDNQEDNAGSYDYPRNEDSYGYRAQDDDDESKDNEYDYGDYKSEYGDMNQGEAYIDDIGNGQDPKVLRKSIDDDSAAVSRENRDSLGNDDARPYNLSPDNEGLIEKRMEFNKLKEPSSSNFTSQLASSTDKILEEAAGNVIYMPFSTTTSHYNDFLQIREDKKVSHRRHINDE